ncbi:tripartite tricarboxylate transporter substrate-binding protein [Variovorax sp. J22R133]|uniref:Bug family tripartite tricarboxylate transporter substrate binding protein n=1 Tax=Variovorax brevis TaxID=3053503 RepID=UPI002578D818|nr:tripartite tricarboxylate transporter substrate-binding protein [Variovorax sp. J22R133]MDM0114195.1 tripartite tricarboxylate transporter substrate-binding protein [Variovorax sp. J22R133]
MIERLFARSRACRTKLCATALLALSVAAPAFAWEPTKPVEFVVPAGTGGGADQMARLIQGIVIKHKLMKEPLIVVNKSGGAGAEGFLAVKEAKGDPYKIVITLSNLFTTPMATGVPFNWKDMTPVAMMALDQFVLWTNADEPYKSAAEYIAAAKAAGPNKFKMGGTGSKQEDQIITVALEKATGTKFIYVPFKGGGEVAVQLVGGHINSTVNNPIEAVAQWRAGKLRAQCVFDEQRMPFKAKVTDTQSWNDIPTCKEAGVPTAYTMLRGIFMPPGIKPDELAFYVDLLTKVRATPDWAEYMEKGAFNQTFLTGEPYAKWLTKAEADHKTLMTEAGFMAPK